MFLDDLLPAIPRRALRTTAAAALILSTGCYDGLERDDADASADTDAGKADDADDGDPSDGDRDPDPDSDDDGPAPSGGAAEIDAYIVGLGTPATPAEAREEGDPGEPEPSGDYVCSTRDLSETQQFAEIVGFASNSHSLFPGALIGGDSIPTGQFAPKVFDRQPITISASLEGVLDGAVSAEIEPSLSAFREAMADILDANVVGQTPANLTFELHEVHSEEQLSLALGIDVSWMAKGISGSFAFDKEETRSRFVVDFAQSYYTVDLDPPGRPSDLFADSVALQDVQDVLADEPPAYVSSVTYGRLVYFAVTSSFSSEELRAALEFGFNGGVADIEGHASLTHSEVLSETQITAFILGGNGDVAVQALNGPEELRTFIEQGGSYGKDSPGAPIGYKLAYLADNTPAKFALTTQTEVEECERVRQNVRIAFDHLSAVSVGDSGGDLEIYGSVYVLDEDNGSYPLFEATGGTNVVSIPQGQSWPAQGEVASDIIPVVPQPGHKFTIYIDLWESDGGLGPDSFGERVIELDFENGWRSDDHVVSLAQDDDHIEVHLSYRPVP